MIQLQHIEANIVRHCNNRCNACSHGAPVAEHYFMPPDVLERDLGILASLLHVGEFHITGGEPLLHAQLEHVVNIIKKSGIADLIVLGTNGKLLSEMNEAIWGVIGALRLSVYPNLDSSVPDMARSKCEALKIRFDEIKVETFWKQFSPSLDGCSFAQCQWKSTCLTVHDGWLFRCPQSAFLRSVINPRIGPECDGLNIRRPEIGESDIVNFLDSSIPLLMCHFCRAYTDTVAWTECDDLEHWVRDSTI